MSLLPPKSSQPRGWGWFGYKGTMCDRAINSDNAPMLAECLERGFFDPEAETLQFKTVRQWCKERAPNCYAMLQERAPL